MYITYISIKSLVCLLRIEYISTKVSFETEIFCIFLLFRMTSIKFELCRRLRMMGRCFMAHSKLYDEKSRNNYFYEELPNKICIRLVDFQTNAIRWCQK